MLCTHKASKTAGKPSFSTFRVIMTKLKCALPRQMPLAKTKCKFYCTRIYKYVNFSAYLHAAQEHRNRNNFDLQPHNASLCALKAPNYKEHVFLIAKSKPALFSEY